jgi:periplasmic protein TonB
MQLAQLSLISFLVFLYTGSFSQSLEQLKTGAAQKAVPENDNDFSCILRIEPAAAFPGGAAALKRFICKYLVHPPDSLLPEDGVEGMVLASFTIEKNGCIADASIVKGIGYGYDEAVLDVIRKMPAWKPAKERGVHVKSYHQLPVVFKKEIKPDEEACNRDSSANSIR